MYAIVHVYTGQVTFYKEPEKGPCLNGHPVSVNYTFIPNIKKELLANFRLIVILTYKTN